MKFSGKIGGDVVGEIIRIKGSSCAKLVKKNIPLE